MRQQIKENFQINQYKLLSHNLFDSKQSSISNQYNRKLALRILQKNNINTKNVDVVFDQSNIVEVNINPKQKGTNVRLEGWIKKGMNEIDHCKQDKHHKKIEDQYWYNKSESSNVIHALEQNRVRNFRQLSQNSKKQLQDSNKMLQEQNQNSKKEFYKTFDNFCQFNQNGITGKSIDFMMDRNIHTSQSTQKFLRSSVKLQLVEVQEPQLNILSEKKLQLIMLDKMISNDELPTSDDENSQYNHEKKFQSIKRPISQRQLEALENADLATQGAFKIKIAQNQTNKRYEEPFFEQQKLTFQKQNEAASIIQKYYKKNIQKFRKKVAFNYQNKKLNEQKSATIIDKQFRGEFSQQKMVHVKQDEQILQISKSTSLCRKNSKNHTFSGSFLNRIGIKTADSKRLKRTNSQIDLAKKLVLDVNGDNIQKLIIKSQSFKRSQDQFTQSKPQQIKDLNPNQNVFIKYNYYQIKDKPNMPILLEGKSLTKMNLQRKFFTSTK